jgi:hypothetical protein
MRGKRMQQTGRRMWDGGNVWVDRGVGNGFVKPGPTKSRELTSRPK